MGSMKKKATIAAIASLVLIFGVTGTAVMRNDNELQLQNSAKPTGPLNNLPGSIPGLL